MSDAPNASTIASCYGGGAVRHVLLAMNLHICCPPEDACVELDMQKWQDLAQLVRVVVVGVGAKVQNGVTGALPETFGRASVLILVLMGSFLILVSALQSLVSLL